MARTTTRANLRTKIRRKADIENATNFISDAEIDDYINESISELWDLVVEHGSADFYIRTSDITLAAGGTGEYNLPADFYISRRVEIVDGDDHTELRPVSMHDLRVWDGSWFVTARSRWPETFGAYRIMGDVTDATGAYQAVIQLTPKDKTGTLRIYYIPHAPVLDSDADVWDGFNGWEEYVVIDGAIKCLEKEESDTTALEVRKQRLVLRIQSMAEMREASFPEYIADVEHYEP